MLDKNKLVTLERIEGRERSQMFEKKKKKNEKKTHATNISIFFL